MYTFGANKKKTIAILGEAPAWTATIPYGISSLIARGWNPFNTGTSTLWPRKRRTSSWSASKGPRKLFNSISVASHKRTKGEGHNRTNPLPPVITFGKIGICSGCVFARSTYSGVVLDTPHITLIWCSLHAQQSWMLLIPLALFVCWET